MKHVKLFEEFIFKSSELTVTVKLSTRAAASFEKELKTNLIKYKKSKPTVFHVGDDPKTSMAIKLTRERFRGDEIIVESFLTEKSGDSYDAGCVMLYFNFPEVYKIQDSIDPDDLYEEEGDRSFGIENEPHCTLLYGLEESVTLEQVKDIIEGHRFGPCNVHNMSLFENEYDVLKFDVGYVNKSGAFLHKCNRDLTKLPHDTKYPDYHPHLTVAYLKKGTGKKYCEMFENQEYNLMPTHVVFSQPDGTKNKIKISTF